MRVCARIVRRATARGGVRRLLVATIVAMGLASLAWAQYRPQSEHVLFTVTERPYEVQITIENASDLICISAPADPYKYMPPGAYTTRCAPARLWLTMQRPTTGGTP